MTMVISIHITRSDLLTYTFLIRLLAYLGIALMALGLVAGFLGRRTRLGLAGLLLPLMPLTFVVTMLVALHFHLVEVK